MRPLRLEPASFVAGLVLLFGYLLITGYLSSYQPYGPGVTVNWGAILAFSAGFVLLLSLALGTALARRELSEATDGTPARGQSR
jgi:hypothetical protein